MACITFMFPGQGSQCVGMTAALREKEPELFDRYLGLAEDASGLPIARYCLEGPLESLTETQVAQPALFAVSLALNDLARRAGLHPDFVAGHSLGEYTACAAAGALSPEEGMRLVALRGRLMAEIQAVTPGAMAAVIGLAPQALRALCEQAAPAGRVAPANLNTPSQIVVSGETAAVDRVMELARDAGAKRAVRLPVGAAFHSEFMKPVQARLAEHVEGLEWREPEVPMVSNASTRVVRTAREVREALIAQIASPVRWIECVQTLAGEGCTSYLELGPGRALCGLVRQIAPEAETAAADTPDRVTRFAQGHPELIRS